MKGLFIIGLLTMAWTGWVFAEETSIPVLTTRWWESFQHPGLATAIELGLSAHPDSASALASIQAAEAAVASARATRRPELGLEAGYRWGRERNVETGGVEDDVDPLFGSARLSWELDLVGRRRAEIDAATARAGQSEADLAGVRLLLSLEIARAYIDVGHLNTLATLNKKQAEDARIIHARAERRAEAGLEPETSRLLALAGWQRAEHRLMQTEIDRGRAQARLTSLVGGSRLEVEPTSLTGFTLPPPPELDAADCILRRPDVVKAQLVWLAARGEATASARMRLPSLSLIVSAAGDGQNAGDSESWSAWAGPVASLPIWNPGFKALSKRDRARERAAEASFRAVSLRAVEEIDWAWAERTRSEEMIGHMRARRVALVSAAETEGRKRAAGLIDDDVFRRARLSATEAARAELQWRVAALHAHLALIAALGG